MTKMFSIIALIFVQIALSSQNATTPETTVNPTKELKAKLKQLIDKTENILGNDEAKLYENWGSIDAKTQKKLNSEISDLQDQLQKYEGMLDDLKSAKKMTAKELEDEKKELKADMDAVDKQVEKMQKEMADEEKSWYDWTMQQFGYGSYVDDDKDSSKDTASDSTKDAASDSTKDSASDSSKDATGDSTKADTPKDVVAAKATGDESPRSVVFVAFVCLVAVAGLYGLYLAKSRFGYRRIPDFVVRSEYGYGAHRA